MVYLSPNSVLFAAVRKDGKQEPLPQEDGLNSGGVHHPLWVDVFLTAALLGLSAFLVSTWMSKP